MGTNEPLYLSGLLRMRMLKHYQNTIKDFDTTSILIENPKTWETFTIDYNGEIKSRNPKFFQSFVYLQEIRIGEGIKEIEKLTKYKYGVNPWQIKGTKFYIYDEVKNIINIILQNSNRKYTFLLLSYLYKIIKFISINELKDMLHCFTDLIEFLNMEGDHLNQIELDLICQKFYQDKYFVKQSTLYELPNLKQNYFHIDENELDQKTREILSLGEFIVPKKVKMIAPNLYNEDTKTQLIALIYFLIPSSKLNKNFLWMLNQEDWDTERIMKYLMDNNNISRQTRSLIKEKLF